MSGNPDSSGFPVLCETVACAGPGTAVRGDPAALLPDFAASLMQVPAVRRLLHWFRAGLNVGSGACL